MKITLNTQPTTPDDLAAFAAEYEEWNKAVQAGFPMPEPEEGEEKPNVDLCDIVRQHDENEDLFAGVGTHEEVTEYWNTFWAGMKARMHDEQ